MNADIELRRWKRWQLKYDKSIGKIGKIDLAIKYSFSVIYEWLTGFGYKPWRFAFSTIILFTVSSIINMNVLPNTIRYNGNIISDISFLDSIFYTYSMMTALGFSTIVPETGLAKILAVSQALVGIGWLGIFTSLLVKRFIK